MSLKGLLATNRLRGHVTSKNELDSLRAVVERDLRDADIPRVSADRRFAVAYNAALQLCKISLACAGYRVAAGPGHHQTTFEAAGFVLDPSASPYTLYFETCRRKRNLLDYDAASVATETEARELVTKAHEFDHLVETWITQHYPRFKR